MQPGPEWTVLEHLCVGIEGVGIGGVGVEGVGIEDEARRDEVVALVTKGLDWGQLIDQSLRHKMLTLVSQQLLAAGLASVMPYRIADHLRGVVAANLHRRRIWYGELAKTVSALQDRGIGVAARKGAAYEATLYHGDGSRWLGDIDLLIEPEASAEVAAIMPGLGYEVGLYDFDRKVVVPFDRKELIKYRLNPDHLPTHSIALDDLLVPVLEIDFACSLTWAKAPYQVPTAQVLRDIHHHEVPGVHGFAVPTLSPVYQFLDTVLHLFREAWIEWWLAMEQDVDLMKFGDVIRLHREYGARLRQDGAFVALVEHYGVVEPVCWVLEHLDRTFATTSVADLGLAGRVTEEFLSSAGGSGQTTRNWSGTMRDRLYAKARRHIFTTSPA